MSSDCRGSFSKRKSTGSEFMDFNGKGTKEENRRVNYEMVIVIVLICSGIINGEMVKLDYDFVCCVMVGREKQRRHG